MNFGYTKKGVGLDVSLRRIENMNFLSERNPEEVWKYTYVAKGMAPPNKPTPKILKKER